MDITRELENMKTSFRGYDKEEVLEFISRLLQETEKEKQKENAALVEQNTRLQASLKEAEDKIILMKEQYRSLSEQMEQLTASLNRGPLGSKETEKGLELILGRAEEIGGFLTKIRKEAEAKKNALIEEARREAKRILEEANHQSAILLEESRQSYQDTVQRATALRQQIDSFREQITPLFSWPDMNLEQEDASVSDILEKLLEDIKEEPVTLKEEQTALREKQTALKEEQTALREEQTALREEPTALREEPTALKGRRQEGVGEVTVTEEREEQLP